MTALRRVDPAHYQDGYLIIRPLRSHRYARQQAVPLRPRLYFVDRQLTVGARPSTWAQWRHVLAVWVLVVILLVGLVATGHSPEVHP